MMNSKAATGNEMSTKNSGDFIIKVFDKNDNILDFVIAYTLDRAIEVYNLQCKAASDLTKTLKSWGKDFYVRVGIFKHCISDNQFFLIEEKIYE